MIVEFNLCDNCGGNPGGHLEKIRITCWNNERSVDKELFLCPHCTQEFLTIVENFNSAVKSLKKCSSKERAVHIFNTVGQRKDSDSNESS